MDKLPERLEICNPEHIKLVRKYELEHGYDRDNNKTIEPPKDFIVTLTAPVHTIVRAKISVQAANEEKAVGVRL